MLASPSLPGRARLQVKPAPVVGHLHPSVSCSHGNPQPDLRGAGMPHDVGQRLLEREEQFLPELGIQRVIRQVLRHVQPASDRREFQHPLRIRTEVARQRGHGVVARIDRPDDFIQRRHHPLRRFAQVFQVAVLFRRQTSSGFSTSELSMLTSVNPAPRSSCRSCATRARSCSISRRRSARWRSWICASSSRVRLRHLPVQHRHPAKRRQRHQAQRPRDPQHPPQRPPRGQCQQRHVLARTQLQPESLGAPLVAGLPFAGLNAADAGDRHAAAVAQVARRRRRLRSA